MTKNYSNTEFKRVGLQLIVSANDLEEIDRFLRWTDRTKGRAYVEAMKLYIERERKEGRYPV